MTPVSITLNAFGPFKEKQSIIFEKLDNIFLITGSTGAGKTTIFDAITFALYGECSTDQKRTESLKSDFAEISAKAYVELIFLVNQKSYKVTRYPRQTVQTKNKEIKWQSEKVILYISETEIITSIKQANNKIIEITGIVNQQFRSIVMLPQGEFKKLLQSDSKEKQEIFRKIFNTSKFRLMSEYLKETAKLKREQLSIKTSTALELSKNLVFEYPYDTVNLNIDSLSEIIYNVKIQNDLQSIKLNTIITKIKQVSESKNKINIENSIEINNKFSMLSEYQIKLENLVKDNHSIQQAKLLKNKLNNLKELLAIEDNTANLTQSLKLITFETNQLENTISKLNKDLAILEKIKSDFPNLEKQTKKLEKELIEIEKTLDSIKDIQKSKDIILELSNNKFSLEEQLKNCNVKIKYLSLVEKKSQNKMISDNIINCIHELKKFKLLSDKYDKILLDQSIYNEKYNMNLYFKIANNLEKETPCPVCGSIIHPNPAKNNYELDNSSLTKLELNLKSIHTKKTKSEINYKLLLSKLDLDDQQHIVKTYKNLKIMLKQNTQIELTLNTQINDYLKLNKLEIFIKNIKCFPTISECLQEQHDINNKILINETTTKNINEKLIIQQKVIQNTNFSLSSLINEKQKISEKINGISKNIIETTANYEILSQNIEYAKQNLKNNNLNVKNQTALLNVLKIKIKDKLTEYGFKNAQEYKDLKLIYKDLESVKQVANTLDNQILKHESQLEHCQITLSSLEKELLNKAPVDILHLKSEKTNLDETCNKLHFQQIQLNSELSNNTLIVNKLEDYMLQIANLKFEFNIVNELSKIANGENYQNISLERYVLANYFDAVLENTNIRLQQMTNNRFTLHRKKLKQKGNIPSGLDLEILDSYTGKYRDSNTLSGGESFKTSLALSLGLSDLLSQNYGGINIGIIFIDEGFGTLDNESLSNVINCLMSIQADGRMVCIISHLQPLKQHIPCKINIIKTNSGSNIVSDY